MKLYVPYGGHIMSIIEKQTNANSNNFLRRYCNEKCYRYIG